MAEVLSPVIASNDRVSALHNRASPSEQYAPTMASSSQNHNNPPRQRGQYSPHNNTTSGYRGTAAAPPVAPYAFKSTPHLRSDQQSAPSTPTTQPLASDNISAAAHRQRYQTPSSVSTPSSSSSSVAPSLPTLTKDDANLFSAFHIPSLQLPGSNDTASEKGLPEATPARYQTHNRSGSGSSSQKASVFEGMTASGVFGTGTLGQFQYNPQQFGVNTSPTLRPQSDNTAGQSTVSSFTNGDKSDLPKRYRRRSSSFGNTIEAGTKTSSAAIAPRQEPASPMNNTRLGTRPTSSGSPSQPSSARTDGSPRSIASADTIKRVNIPSPLSRPLSGEAPAAVGSVPLLSSPYSVNPIITQSPAVAAMAALKISEKDSKRASKSRFRRAFSFGSAAELKRSGEGDAAMDRAKARQEQFSSELDEEQDAIARKQEAAGLGNSIYTGQGGVFAGSTDNLSIASTASSASMMLRKMGQGMKKGGRSIKGLFRPKSVIGVPAADGPSTASVGQVSMVTVEAEREHINVNPDPHDQAGGGTGFPRLERNSIDAAKASTPFDATPANDTRRAIVGGEQDRQEVLAAVKRGILKRTPTSPLSGSPMLRPADGQDQPSPSIGGTTFGRSGSPVPSTTSSEPRRTGHRRTDSHTIEGDDYFASVPRLTSYQSSRSLPGTPRSIARNISFSPRIQFHDVWSSTEYDRRGEIATCNRLTPLLAQQIKEELNTFKMEMEVHEQSKPHTHFF